MSNRDGCGAVVTATTSTATMTRQVMCGSTSVASGNETAVHFGLGPVGRLAELEVVWPSGVHQQLTDVAADRVITIEEPPS
jgi:hypothetical protein